MTISKIFIVAVYGLLSFTAQAQNASSISTYSGPEIKYEQAKNPNVQTQLSEQHLLSPLALTLPINEGFEAGLVKFNNPASGNTVNWSLNTSFYHSGAKSASNVSTVNNDNILLETDVMDLTGPEFPFLEFWHIAKTEVGYDKCYVEISTNGGTTWDILTGTDYQGTAAEYTSRQYFHENSYDTWGSTNTTPDNATWWKKEKFSLAAYKTVNVKIRFRLKSDGSINRAGWFLDDITVYKEARIYVDADALGVNNGTSWYNAYNSLQDAMDAANTGDEIWVASGTYKPTKDHTGSTSPTNPRDKNFHLAKDLKIYGGFLGNEALLSQRNWKAYETILSGDFNGDDVISGSGATLSISDTSENAYHVLILADLTSDAVIDGLTIKGGNASGQFGDNFTFASRTFSRYYGGGVYLSVSSPRFANLIISGNGANYAAGMYATNSSSPNISNTLFKLNLAYINGGGFALTLSSSTINNSVFTGNKTILGTGGGIYNDRCNTTVTNSTFVGNSSASQSAGIINWNTTETLTISNCIFWGNTYNGGGSSSGVDIHAVTTSPIVSNCMTQFYTAGTNLIIGQNPVFKDSANGDFQITPCSPAVNTGNNALWNATGLSGDYEGNTRPFGGTVDIGAFECQALPFLTAPVIYVNDDAGGNNDGTSWANAFNNLQDALDNQCSGLDIWVAAGTYLPTSDHSDNNAPQSNPLKTFHLKEDMKIYGGFDGTETILSERDWTANVTILSGDFNDDDVVSGNGSTLSIASITENAYHVLMTADLSNNAVIDGFTIKGGNFGNGQGTIFYASKSYVVEEGAGMYNYQSSPTIKNVVFTGNSAKKGGGMKNEFSSPKISYASFTKNLVSELGGGMYNISSSPLVINTTFFANSAKFGGGMFNYASSPVITNVTFSGNAASLSAGGGGMYNQLGSAPVITNSIFWNNTQGGNNDTYGADINVNSSTPSITYSLTQESSYYSSGTGIINNQNPQFIDAANGDLRLSRCSSAINTGDNAAWIATGLSIDVAGNPRPFGTSVVDMGAYEFQGNNQFTNAIYVKHNANGDNDGSTWAHAYKDLQDAMDNECGSLPIWVAAGTYYPTQAPDGTVSTGPLDRNNAFHLASDMPIYGGFAGTEAVNYDLNLRDFVRNKTILSGDIDNATNPDVVTGSGSTLSITKNAENAYHVLITANLTSSSIINGFQIKGGNANKLNSITFATRTYFMFFGGGMYNNYSNPTISNTTFQGNSASNSGGGMYNESSSPSISNTTFLRNSTRYGGGLFNKSSSPSISNTTFEGNYSSSYGGGLHNESSSPIISNTTFQGNSAFNGAGMYNIYSSTTIRNTIFQGNLAYNGGGMHNSESSTSISNSTFQGNSATSYGGGIYNIANSPSSIVNSIFWENMANSVPNSFYNHFRLLTISHSLIPEADSTALSNNSNGSIGSINNMVYNQNPQFVDAANGFLQIKCNSLAINAGTNTGAPADDITGFTRVGLPDMGAYEYGQALVYIQIPDGTNPNLNGIPILKASSQILNTNNVLYQGSNNVQLLPGFSVAPSGGAATVFRAEIGGGCEYQEE